MTTYIDFTQSTVQNFQFQATLDGEVYVVDVFWLLFGQRWYITITDLSGNIIVTRAMVGSPIDYDISLTDGYFTSTLVYRQANQQFEISP